MCYKASLFVVLILGFATPSILLHAQNNLPAEATGKDIEAYQHNRLFDNDEIMHFKLTGKLNALFNDRYDNMVYHPMLLLYRQKDSSLKSIQLRVKTRGHFRRLKSNCKMPPLLLNFFRTEKIKNTVFEKENKLKLVVPCQGDEYIIKEWLVYKLYNIITEKSFMAKLVQVDFEDSLMQRKTETHYCILIEDEKKVAERNKAFVWNRKMLPMRNVNADDFKKMAVFQYMIGNTDWGVPFLQNIVLITRDSAKAPSAVPYDFDHAGIVDAPYAGPAPELELSSIRERVYRGYCESDKKNFAKTFEFFNSVKNDIYNIYTNCTLLSSKYLKFVNRYLDDFYKTINNDRDVEAEFLKPCRTDVRVEIKGLKD